MNAKLSKREIQCLYWASQDKSLIETAQELHLSAESIKRYRKSTLKKLKCKTISGALFLAIQQELFKK